ncbi:MAG: MATE family efflux transporter [Anaerovoracaceae bacterium]|nr:MATE family efflux transporter [Anaerovoracaceae bacterium]
MSRKNKDVTKKQHVTTEQLLDGYPIRKLVIRLGIPAMFAQFFNILYSIVDRIFVGNLPEAGELSLAGIGVSAPALTAISAFAAMVGVGGSSLMSIRLGQQKVEEAKKVICNAFLMLLLLSVFITAIMLAFKKEILYTLGCSHTLYAYAEPYYTIYLCGTLAALCGGGLNYFILAQGKAKEGMISVILGSLVNLALDPIFIYGFDMGVKGAACATVIAQISSMVYVLSVLRKPELQIRVGFGGYRMSIIRRISFIGLMPLLITLLDNGVLILMNATLRRYGGESQGDVLIACATVIQCFMAIVFCPSQGIASGCSTLFSYHYGAKHYEKISQTFCHVFILCALYTGILCIAVQCFPAIFARMFLNDTDTIQLAAQALRMYTMGILGVAVQYTFVDGLTAMGKLSYALPLSLFRKIVYLICIIVLPLFTAPEHVFYAGTISDIVGAGFTLIVFLTVIRKRLKRELENSAPDC